MNGANLVTTALADAGVTYVFTLSGNQIMPLFDAFIDADIKPIHVRHEAAAVYMADAWAQLSGDVGVAMVAAGPGFANALGGLFSARASESPMAPGMPAPARHGRRRDTGKLCRRRHA